MTVLKQKNISSTESLKFEGMLIDHRLIIVEAGSKKDTLSFFREDELTKLRNKK